MDLYTVFKLSSTTVLYEGILINLEQAPFFLLYNAIVAFELDEYIS